VKIDNRGGCVSMEFKDVVKNRYSCKKYGTKKVEREKLESILTQELA
jgi:nitroreductase